MITKLFLTVESILFTFPSAEGLSLNQCLVDLQEFGFGSQFYVCCCFVTILLLIKQKALFMCGLCTPLLPSAGWLK